MSAYNHCDVSTWLEENGRREELGKEIVGVIEGSGNTHHNDCMHWQLNDCMHFCC